MSVKAVTARVKEVYSRKVKQAFLSKSPSSSLSTSLHPILLLQPHPFLPHHTFSLSPSPPSLSFSLLLNVKEPAIKQHPTAILYMYMYTYTLMHSRLPPFSSLYNISLFSNTIMFLHVHIYYHNPD